MNKVPGMVSRAVAAASFLVALLGLGGAAPAQAYNHKISLGESFFYFDPGEGYCRLDPTRGDLEASFVAFSERLSRDSDSEILDIFAPCDDLQELRTWKILCLDEWSLLVSYRAEGGIERAPAATRKAALDHIEAEMEKGVSVGNTWLNERMSWAIPDYIEEEIGTVEFTGLRYAGVLGRDEAGVHAGVEIETDATGVKARTASLISVSTVEGYVVGYANYGPYESLESYQPLLARAVPAMRSLLKNDPAGSTPDSAPQLAGEAKLQQAALTGEAEAAQQAERRSAAQLNAALFAGFKVSLYAGAIVLPILGAWFLWARHQRAKALVAERKR